MLKNLNYIFTDTASPVQAEGTIDGKAFYFRSRHDQWTFAVSEDADLDPVDIDSPQQGFFILRQYGTKRYEASYMPLDEAEKIIEDCALLYINQRANNI
jgi:hypothetical protein